MRPRASRSYTSGERASCADGQSAGTRTECSRQIRSLRALYIDPSAENGNTYLIHSTTKREHNSVVDRLARTVALILAVMANSPVASDLTGPVLMPGDLSYARNSVFRRTLVPTPKLSQNTGRVRFIAGAMASTTMSGSKYRLVKMAAECRLR